MYSESYIRYILVRDGVWLFFQDFGIDRLPVNLMSIFERLGILVQTYREAEAMLDSLEIKYLCGITDGFTLRLNDQIYVFYNDQIYPPGRIKFTLGHELGHIICDHKGQPISTLAGGAVLSTRNNGEWDSDPQERDANIFASRLLAPARILKALDIHEASEIMELCGLSEKAAKYRAKRMEVLYKRGAWDRSPLERKVYEQFKPFIMDYSKDKW